MKIWIDTDPHGMAGISAGEKLALNRGITARICLGDVWDVNHARRIDTHYIHGNHEKDEHWARQVEKVTLHADYSTFQLGGLKFGVLGRMDEDVIQDAIKADPRLSILDKILGHPNNRSFAKRQDASQLLKGCDVLLFHDSPAPYVGSGFVGGSPYLRDILETVQPKYVFHGHIHQLQTRRWKGIEIIGLPPIDPVYVQQGWAILDTETLDVFVETKSNLRQPASSAAI